MTATPLWQRAPKLLQSSSKASQFRSHILDFIREQTSGASLSSVFAPLASTTDNQDDNQDDSSAFIPILLNKMNDLFDEIFAHDFLASLQHLQQQQLLQPGRATIIHSICQLFIITPTARRAACDYFRSHPQQYFRFIDLLVSSGFVQRILDLIEAMMMKPSNDDGDDEREVELNKSANHYADINFAATNIRFIFNCLHRLSTELTFVARWSPQPQALNFFVFSSPSFLNVVSRAVDLAPNAIAVLLPHLGPIFGCAYSRVSSVKKLLDDVEDNAKKRNDNEGLTNFFSSFDTGILQKLRQVYNTSLNSSTQHHYQREDFQNWMFFLRCFTKYATDDVFIKTLLSSSLGSEEAQNNFHANFLVALLSHLHVDCELAHPICRLLLLFSTRNTTDDFQKRELFKLVNTPIPMFLSDAKKVSSIDETQDHPTRNNNTRNHNKSNNFDREQNEEQEELPTFATPLQIAAYSGEPAVCELLIQNGAQVDGRILIFDKNDNHHQTHHQHFDDHVYGEARMTPLILAVSSSRHRCDVVSVLLEPGQRENSIFNDNKSSSTAVADVTLPDADGCFPLDYANDEPKCSKCFSLIEQMVKWRRPL